ncbi:MAG TPA: cystathionine beta-lyase [Caulobacteraceae bacterium]
MTAVVIRLARADDLARIDAVEASANRAFEGVKLVPPATPSPPPPPEGPWARALADGTIWVADDPDAGVIGFIQAEVEGDALHIAELDVTFERQQQGHGRRLMQTAIAWAKARGLAAALLTTYRQVRFNAPFYASLGFVELAPAEAPGWLAAILATDAARGLQGRCAMALDLHPRDATRLIRAGKTPSDLLRTVGPPIQKGSTVLVGSAAALYDERRPTYGRGGLAAQEALKSALAELEGARAVRLFPSGLAAMAGAIMAVLKAGDDVLITDSVYKPTRRFCDRVLARFGVTSRYFAPDAPPEAVLAMATPATRLIVLETPGSLTFEMQDVPAIAAAARERGILTVIDNTWAAGLLFKPLAHGVDISVQALTKYVGGHSDLFMGSAACATRELEVALDRAIVDFGHSVASEDAYQMLRGLRTLPTRMARHGASSLEVAGWLGTRTEVAEVLHPALPGAPGHALWRRHFSGAAGLFAIVLKDASEAQVAAFLDHLALFGLGFSWGGFESLALNADPQFEVRETPPRFDGPVVRLNIGLEDPADLIADLGAALDSMAKVG